MGSKTRQKSSHEKRNQSPSSEMEVAGGRFQVSRPGPSRTDYSTHLWGNLYASIHSSGVCVDIWQYWLPPNQTEVVPTKKGICPRPSEYTKLKDTARVIGDFVPELSSTVPCPYQSNHMNQLGFLKCPECNPDNYTEWWHLLTYLNNVFVNVLLPFNL